MILISELKKLRNGEIEGLIQSHSACRVVEQGFEPVHMIPEPCS